MAKKQSVIKKLYDDSTTDYVMLKRRVLKFESIEEAQSWVDKMPEPTGFEYIIEPLAKKRKKQAEAKKEEELEDVQRGALVDA